MTVLLINIFAFAVAMLLTKNIKGTNIFRTVFFMPNLIGGIVLGYVWQLLLNGNESNIFNLGNGVGFTVKEVIETARKVTGKPIKAVEEGRRAGDPAVLIASSEKAKNILGWKPEHADLEEIIASAWKWHSSHPQGYCSVQKEDK